MGHHPKDGENVHCKKNALYSHFTLQLGFCNCSESFEFWRFMKYIENACGTENEVMDMGGLMWTWVDSYGLIDSGH